MSNYFSVSDAESLALHAMIMIANNPDRPVRIRDISAAFGFSEAHLAKVLNRLTRGGLVVATRGPSGGYRLGKPSEQITLLDIYRVIEGETPRNPCMFRITPCDGSTCALGAFFNTLSDQVERKLQTTRLSDITYYKTFPGANRRQNTAGAEV